jgi:hypothetical protein
MEPLLLFMVFPIVLNTSEPALDEAFVGYP